MTVPRPGSAGVDEEIAGALKDLVALVRSGVPGCDGASVSLLRRDTPSTVAASDRQVEEVDGTQYDHDSGPCVTSMKEGHEVVVDDYRTDRRWEHVSAAALAAGLRSSLSLPLTEDGTVLGGLNLYAHATRSFTSASRDAAEAFARQAVIMLGYLQQLHAERAAADREREVSAALQRSLLPRLPELPGITCAARYRVASTGSAQVGGDWYDLFALPDGAIGVAIGDVMGHDLAAVAAMGQLRSVLRSYAYEGSSPSVVLDRLDRLVQDFEMAQLATAIYGRLILDDATGGAGMLLYTNAGHLPPLLRTPGDGRVQQLRRGVAPLIGAVPPGLAARGEGAVLLPAGSLLLLYTDGLVESRDRDLDTGIGLLSDALAAADPDVPLDQLCDDLLAALAQPDQDDDIALLALRLSPPTSSTGRSPA